MKTIPLPVVRVELEVLEDPEKNTNYVSFNVTLNGFVVGNWDDRTDATWQARGLRRALRSRATHGRVARDPAATDSRR